jgi:hypothetical protein
MGMGMAGDGFAARGSGAASLNFAATAYLFRRTDTSFIGILGGLCFEVHEHIAFGVKVS